MPSALNLPSLSEVFRKWILLLAWCGGFAAAHAGILLRTNFEAGSTWPEFAGYSTTVGGSVTATAIVTTAGTIDVYGTNTSSSGLRLGVNSSAGTGAWTAGVDSGLLDLQTANPITHLGLITLSFSLSASASNPIVLRLESQDSIGRTGGLRTLIYPAAPNFYQRYSIDLSSMIPDGAGTFDPTNPKLRIFFEIGDSVGDDGWSRSSSHELKIDNVNYSTPKYYVKNSSPGSDSSNNGLTEATPFKTVNKAIGLAAPGDIIVLMGQDTVADHFLGSVTINKPAAPDAWIVLRSYPGQKPVLRHDQWNIVNMAQGSSSNIYTGTQVASYIEIRGLTVRGYSSLDANGDRTLPAAYQPFIGLVDGRANTNGITVDSRYSTLKSHNIRVADNVVEYCPGGGISIIEADRASIENNITHSNAWWMIYAGSGISTLHLINAEANNEYRNLYQGNHVYDNETMVPWIDKNGFSDGNGIILDTHNREGYTGRNLVQNNLVYNNGGNGISALGSDRTDIVHNTVFRNSASTRIEYSQIAATYTSADVRVINNIVVAPANATGNSAWNEATVSATQNAGNIVFQNNILHGEGNNAALPGNATFADNITTAPQFLSPSFDPATNDFRLRFESPGQSNARIISYRRGLDLDTRTRLIGAANTRGAYQVRPGEAFAPIFSPQSGNLTSAQSVSLLSDTPGISFIYTTNGTEPAVDGSGAPLNGFVYTAPFTIGTATTVKALAWKSGLAPSYVSTATYTFNPAGLAAVPAPTFYQIPRNLAGTRRVFLLTRTPGAYVRFTTDGSTPTTTTGTLSGDDPITVSSAATIKAIAYKPGSGRAVSSVATNDYVVRFAVGSRADGTGIEAIGANTIRFALFTAGGDLTTTRIFARVGAITGSYRAAIYAHDTGNHRPGALLKATDAITAPAAGWQSFGLTSPQALTNGTTYWLAIWSNDPAAGIYRETTGGELREATATFSATWPPSPSSNPATNTTSNYSIFATNDYTPLLNAGANQSITGTNTSLAAIAAAATSNPISLVNPSFENATGYNGNAGVLLGWNGSSSFGNVRANTGNSLFTSGMNGNNVMTLNGRISQTTAATFVEGVTYRLTVNFGRTLSSTSPFGGISFGFLQNGSTSAYIAGSGQLFVGNANLPANGVMGTYTVTYTATAADAGNPVTIGATDFFSSSTNYGIDNFTLSSIASDVPLPSGTLNTTWSIVSGPGTVNFGNAGALATAATFSTPGNYVLRISGTDPYFPMLSPASSDVVIIVGAPPAMTATSLTSSVNPSYLGGSVTYTANVTSGPATPNGIVTFHNGITSLGAANLVSGTATLATSALPAGTSAITAVYAGNSTYATSTSAAVNQAVIRTDGSLRQLAINAAGPDLPGTGFIADTGFTGGSVTTTTNSIDLTGVDHPAPEAAYQSERYATNVTYTLDGFVPSAAYLVRLHFSENWFGIAGSGGVANTVGERLFDISINGTLRLADFDIYAAAGAPNKVVVREFIALANPAGQLVIVLASALDNAAINGLEIYTASAVDTWRADNFTPAQLDNPAISGPFADADGDGICNLLELALGSDPHFASTTALPTVARNPDGALTLSFLRASAALTYTVESSDLLTGWKTVSINPDAVGGNVTVADPESIGEPHRFLRLRVTAP